jgi:hypothetical protein
MMRSKFFFILFFSLFVGVLHAQTVSEQEFKKRFELRLYEISKKLYLSAIEGRIIAYRTDSLASVVPLEDRRKTGMRLITRFDSNGHEVWDTIPFGTDSLVKDFPIVLQSVVRKDLSRQEKIVCVAPSFRVYFNYNVASIMPLFYINADDFAKVLTPTEIEFLKLYAGFRRLEPNDDLLNANVVNPNRLKYYLEEYVNNGRIYLHGKLSASLIPEFLIEHLRGAKYYSLFEQQLLFLYDGKMKISPNAFGLKHKIEIYTQIPIGNNPVKVIDTMYSQLPYKFDSLSITKEKQFSLVYYQKNLSNNTFSQYTVSSADIKKWLNPSIYRIIQLSLE